MIHQLFCFFLNCSTTCLYFAFFAKSKIKCCESKNMCYYNSNDYKKIESSIKEKEGRNGEKGYCSMWRSCSNIDGCC